MPMKRFTLVSTTYAVLGILNTKEAGYIRGVIDHLAKGKAAISGKNLLSLRAFPVILLMRNPLPIEEQKESQDRQIGRGYIGLLLEADEDDDD